MTANIKIGDMLFRRARVRQTSGAIVPGFLTGLVEGETPRSWKVRENSWNEPTLVSKKALVSRGDRFDSALQWYVESDALDMVWLSRNRPQIVGLVQDASPTVLRQIAALVGYKEEKAE